MSLSHHNHLAKWAGFFTGPLSLLLDFCDVIESTSSDASAFYRSFLAQVERRVLVASHVTCVPQPSQEVLAADFDGHRDDVIRTILADIERKVSAYGTDARLAFSGLYMSGGMRGWDREEVIRQVREGGAGRVPSFCAAQGAGLADA
ncbi:hypothetical protein MRX96_006130 [Rhipicephalus microplus]